MNLKLFAHSLFALMLGIFTGLLCGFCIFQIIRLIFVWGDYLPSWGMWLYGIITFISSVICIRFFMKFDKSPFEPKK